MANGNSYPAIPLDAEGNVVDSMTVIQFTDDADQPGSGGGSQTVRIADLGVIDFATVFAAGPTDLATLAAGEFLSTVRFTDTDVVEPNNFALQIGIGTPHSFGWFAFAWLRGSLADSFGMGMFDTLSYAANAYAYQSDAAVFGVTGDASDQAMVISTPGPIQVAVFQPSSVPAGQTGFGDGFRYAAITAWASATHYDDTSGGTPGTTAAPRKAAITANGTVWTNTGTAGTSGGSSPDFAGNAGGTVADGANIVWTDTTLAAPTMGTVRAAAEIWTPA
jgi:hypothetical protein